MTKQKLSMSEKIRKQLDLGKTPKEISKYLKCSAGLVYAVRSADKKKEEKTSYAVKQRDDTLNALATKPGAVRYGDVVLVPKDYAEATHKRNFVQRFFNWICGG